MAHPVAASRVTLNVSQGPLTINENDALAGAGALVKAGNGILVLGGVNTNFAGSLDITGGTLGFGAGGRLSAQTAVSVGAGTLALNNTTQTIGSLAGVGSVQLGTGSLTTGALNCSTTFAGVMMVRGRLPRWEPAR